MPYSQEDAENVVTRGGFESLYVRGTWLQRFYKTAIHIGFPIVLQFVIFLAGDIQTIKKPMLIFFGIAAILWIAGHVHVSRLDQKKTDYLLEEENAIFNEERKLFHAQLVRYFSILGHIHAKDIRFINKILQNQKITKDHLVSLFNSLPQLKNTIQLMSDYLKKYCKADDYRLTLMLPTDDKLYITHWSEWSNTSEIPYLKANKIGLSKRQGCAGKAWDENRPIYIPSVPRDLKGSNLYKLVGSNHKQRTKSIVSLPLIDRNSAPHQFLGVLNLTTTTEDYFTKPSMVEEHLDVEEIEPYVQRLIFYIKLLELYSRSR